MSSLEEQLALFEKEVLSVADDSSSQRPTVNVTSSSNGNGLNNNSNGTSTAKFVPHQLRVNQHPIANFMRPSGGGPHQTRLPLPPAVIESGPTLYNKSNGKASGGLEPKQPSAAQQQHQASTSSASAVTAFQAPPQMNPPQLMKTMALPSDVELLAAKKQASKAHENSYLGQVLRGEKKMKRFVRSGGGQVWEDPSLAEWDPNDFRIFCGDLGNEVSDELLAKAFRKYPSFQKAKVVRDSRTNKSKGYGFVSFKHQDDFIRACREMDGKYVGNRPIKLRKSNWKERNLEVVRKKDKEKKKLGLFAKK